mmetsp:Transcript_9922/g.26330  ORF Transcript_9922/g.26330 Transcript_9922/m.26330 type:complete len:232 (-) Transcript_9922:288-983(-)
MEVIISSVTLSFSRVAYLEGGVIFMYCANFSESFFRFFHSFSNSYPDFGAAFGTFVLDVKALAPTEPVPFFFAEALEADDASSTFWLSTTLGAAPLLGVVCSSGVTGFSSLTFSSTFLVGSFFTSASTFCGWAFTSCTFSSCVAAVILARSFFKLMSVPFDFSRTRPSSTYCSHSPYLPSSLRAEAFLYRAFTSTAEVVSFSSRSMERALSASARASSNIPIFWYARQRLE